MTDEELEKLRKRALAALREVVKRREWQHWKTIGEYIQTGRQWAMQMSNSNQPHGIRYNQAVEVWFTRNKQFRDGIEKDARNDLMRCMENLPAIETFLDSMEPRARRRLNHPTSIIRAYRRNEAKIERESALAAAEKHMEEAARADDGTPLNVPIHPRKPIKTDTGDVVLSREDGPAMNAMRIKKGFDTKTAKEIARQLARLMGMAVS